MMWKEGVFVKVYVWFKFYLVKFFIYNFWYKIGILILLKGVFGVNGEGGFSFVFL